ncbi:MAG: hypothetical protein N4A68_03385 [Maledivibacter sp.]|nr:hypothetical protein [Maledivibacter sp.]
MKDKNRNLFIVSIGIIFWILYLCDSEMSRYGIYTIFSYNTHEVLSIIPFLSITVTVFWLLGLIIKFIRDKSIKANKFLCILLIILFIVQGMYILDESQIVTTSFVTDIDRINRDKMEIVIYTDEYDLTLDCPMIVLDLLKTDGTEYGITYEWNKKNPKYGKLCIVQSIN